MGDGQVDPRRRGLFNFRALRAQAAAWPMLKGSPGSVFAEILSPREGGGERERETGKKGQARGGETREAREEEEEEEGGQPRGNEQGVTLSRSRQSGGLYDAPDTVSRISPDALIIAPSPPPSPSALSYQHRPVGRP